jgi:hypothetical protein
MLAIAGEDAEVPPTRKTLLALQLAAKQMT